MPTAEFRRWIKTIGTFEASYWRALRNQRAKARYEKKRPALLASQPSPDAPMMTKEITHMTNREVREYIKSLPEDERAAFRRARKREAWQRWREEHKEEHRERQRAAYHARMEELRSDPEALAAYRAKEAERMRRARVPSGE